MKVVDIVTGGASVAHKDRPGKIREAHDFASAAISSSQLSMWGPNMIHKSVMHLAQTVFGRALLPGAPRDAIRAEDALEHCGKVRAPFLGLAVNPIQVIVRLKGYGYAMFGLCPEHETCAGMASDVCNEYGIYCLQ